MTKPIIDTGAFVALLSPEISQNFSMIAIFTPLTGQILISIAASGGP